MANVLSATKLVALGVDEAQALVWAANIDGWLAVGDEAQCWDKVKKHCLSPLVPFAVHQYIYNAVFATWPQEKGPPPAWQPGQEEQQRSRIASLVEQFNVADVPALIALSVEQPSVFWQHALADLGIKFDRPPTSILNLSAGVQDVTWLPGAELNIAQSCFLADPTATAIVYQGPGLALQTTSFSELQQQVAHVAAALAAHEFNVGDALAINMPMIPQSVVIYLGIVAAGMVVVSIADSMAPDEVATRLRIANAKAIFTVFSVQRGGKSLPLYEKVLQSSPPRAIVLQSEAADLRAGDVRWEDFLAAAPGPHVLAPHVSAPATSTNMLFSSGTTGEPKAIAWTHLTPIKAAMDGAYHLDIQKGDVVAWPTNLGWMMGPWLIYAALINRATIALYADAPTTRGFGQFVQDAKVNVLGLVPSIVKAWRSDDRMLGLDWSRLKCFGSTGEASNAEDYLYLMMLAGYRPVIEYCGGTEIGGGYLTGTLLQNASPATFTTAALGSRFVLLDEHHQAANSGEVFLVPPSLGYSQSLVNRNHHEVYFEGTPKGPAGEVLRRHGDELQALPGGYYRALGRVDDTMNLGGIKVSSAEIERVMDGVPGVARTAAVAVPPAGGGPSLLVVYAVAGSQSLADLKSKLQDAIKSKLNPLFRIHDLVLLDQMPVTASNKIMRRELRARYAPG